MKTRIVSISLAIALAFSVGLIGCGSAVGYNLTISSTDGGSVTTPGEGTFTYDQVTVVDLAAEAEDGYRFVKWTGDVATIGNVSAATTIITTNGDYSITANFAYGPAIPLKNPGDFVQMTPYDIDSLDPAWGYDGASGEQVQYIYETLVYFEGTKTDQFVPVLATEWDLLDDNVTYRFKIREGVKFHEGGDLTPEDVEYSVEREMVLDAGPAWMLYKPLLDLWGSRDGNRNVAVTFDQIDNAVEVEGDWVVFHLSDAAWRLAFLQILSSPWASIVDKEWCVDNGDWDGTEETWRDHNNPGKADSYLYNHTNGTGPWKLEEWDPGVQIKLVRNDDYWREPASFERVITRIVEEWATRKEALLAGDVDLVNCSSPWISRNHSELEDIEELEGIADLNVYQNLPELAIDGFFFNFNIANDSQYIGSGALDGNGIPPGFFSDIDVRKGFCYAFDWETYISDVHVGEAEQRGSPIIEGLLFYNPDASTYSFDLAKAEEHLKTAWAGEVWEKGFKFTLVYNPASLRRQTACKILAENLAAINPKFQVSILPIAWETYDVKIRRTRDLPMFQGTWIVDYPHPDDFVWGFMATDGFFSVFQGYGYPELDELIKGAFEELDQTVQKDKYYELQERYYEDAPSVMLCQLLGRYYFTKYVEGFYYNPFIGAYAGLPLYYMSKSSS